MKRKLAVALSAVSLASISACSGEDAGPFKKLDAKHLQSKSSEIVGGTVVNDFSYPYVPFIYNEGQGYLCTGTLIDDFVVLTAAHCVEDGNESNYVICGGDDPFGDGCYWLTGAAQVAMHPNYNSSTIANDIGIIVLDAEPAAEDPTNTTQPITYLGSDPGDIYEVGTTFTAVGFGVTSGNGRGDGIKRQVQLSMTDIYLDIFEYGNATYNTCSGDSGGPALKEINGKMTVIGVVSYGDQNCSSFGGDSRTDYNPFESFISSFAGAGATPTPTNTPNPGGDDDDDDDDGPTDPKEEDGNEADDPFGNVGCSVSGMANVATSPLGLFGLIALAGLVTNRRRR